MSWLSRLVETYDHCYNSSSFKMSSIELAPTDHVSPQAHIEVVLNDQGEFRTARFIGKEPTLMPATQESAGRTNAPVPHGLSDSLQYLASDYAERGGSKKAAYELFTQQLNEWCCSDYIHSMAEAVRVYLNKGTLIDDLARCDVLTLTTDGKFKTEFDDSAAVPELLKILGKSKGQFKDPGSAVVRWCVESQNWDGSRCWEDKTLQQSWCDYIASKSTTADLCYVTGEVVTAGSNHPKFLRRPGDGAKLISTPTSDGLYTYKGRVASPKEACTIGWQASQKGHNALRWLIARQGYKNGEQVIVSWEVRGAPIPEPFQNTLKAFGIEDDTGDSGQFFSNQLNKKIQGYQRTLGSDERIVTLVVEAATTGRLSVTFFREISGSDFLERIERWHQQFSWLLRYTLPNPDNPKKTMVRWCFSAPSPKDIAEAAYGRNLDDKLKQKTIERLLPCILDGSQIPEDIVNSAVRRASNPMAFKNDEQWQWEKTLGVACALFKGWSHRSDNPKEYTMEFDLKNKERDYLYGCLLAVAENIEAFALNKSEENRATNAKRLFLSFSQRPYSTWLNIEKAIHPYTVRLYNTHSGFIHSRENLLGDILRSFQPEDYTSDIPLSGEFLMGYRCLRNHLLQKKSTDNANDTITGEA